MVEGGRSEVNAGAGPAPAQRPLAFLAAFLFPALPPGAPAGPPGGGSAATSVLGASRR
jgi:hypothetical protein